MTRRALRYLARFAFWAVTLILLALAVWGVVSIAAPERQEAQAPLTIAGEPDFPAVAPRTTPDRTPTPFARDGSWAVVAPSPGSGESSSPMPSYGLDTARTRHPAGPADLSTVEEPSPSVRSNPRLQSLGPGITKASPPIDKSALSPGPNPLPNALPSDCRLPCPGVARVGPASWYRDPRAGPNALYAAIPGYTGGVMAVVVCSFPDGQANCLTLPVVTSCGCLRHTPDERVVDLSPAAFLHFAPLSAGLVRVQITVLGGQP